MLHRVLSTQAFAAAPRLSMDGSVTGRSPRPGQASLRFNLRMPTKLANPWLLFNTQKLIKVAKSMVIISY
jgi:hypothetical protein